MNLTKIPERATATPSVLVEESVTYYGAFARKFKKSYVGRPPTSGFRCEAVGNYTHLVSQTDT